MKTLLTLLLLTLSTASFAADEMAVNIINNDNENVGMITLKQGTVGAMLDVDLKNLPAGKHGFHLHSVGTCEPSEHFKTAAGHIGKSDDKAHGYLNENGPELGDLPNLYVHEDGTVKAELFVPQLDITDMLDEDGSSFMIHADPDDHMTQPIGGAGARIACGVIKAEVRN